MVHKNPAQTAIAVNIADRGVQAHCDAEAHSAPPVDPHSARKVRSHSFTATAVREMAGKEKYYIQYPPHNQMTITISKIS